MSERTGVPGRLVALLRADAGPDVGFGHLARCVAVADGLVRRGARAVVLMTDNSVSDADLESIRRGVPIERQPPMALDGDAEATVVAARRLGASAVISDMCSQRNLARLPAVDAFHAQIRRELPYLAVFAGGSHLDPSADLVVNPYLLPKADATGVDPDAAHVLWGPRYFIFRPEFARAAALPRQINERVERVAVVVGGSDPAALTPRIAEALATVLPTADVRIVIGPGTPALERALPEHWRVVGPPDDMAALFLWCDLAITGDGLTKYETAVTGTPSIIVARPDSNARMNATFVAGGTTICVEPGTDGTWGELQTAIRRLVDSRQVREEMSRRGRALADGRGLDRVLDRMTIA